MFQLTCPGNQCIRNDVLSGLTVALALVPEAVAFAFVVGVEPLVEVNLMEDPRYHVADDRLA